MPDPDNNGSTEAPWATRRDPSGKRFFSRMLPWLGALLLLAAVAWGLWPKPTAVETGTLTRGPLTVGVSEEGKTRVRNRYVVAAPVAGQMRRVSLKPGDDVVAGKTFLTAIEPMVPPLLDPRARTEAEAMVALQEATHKQTVEAVAARQVAHDMAITDRDRIRSATVKGAVSQVERDRVEGEASMRAAELRSAEFSLQVIDYELARAKAALERPESISPGNLVEVKSPVSGRVLRVIQESETVVAPGMAILEIGDPTDIEIEAEILSRDAVSIHTGDSVKVDQWGGDKPLTGSVRRIEPSAFTKISALGVEEQRVIVLCDLTNPKESAKALGDRFRVEVRVAVWHADDVLTIPAGALFREGNAWKTFVFRGDKAVLTNLQAGHTDGHFTEILSGLQPGDEVLLHPPDTVKDGSSVKKR